MQFYTNDTCTAKGIHYNVCMQSTTHIVSSYTLVCDVLSWTYNRKIFLSKLSQIFLLLFMISTDHNWCYLENKEVNMQFLYFKIDKMVLQEIYKIKGIHLLFVRLVLIWCCLCLGRANTNYLI